MKNILFNFVLLWYYSYLYVNKTLVCKFIGLDNILAYTFFLKYINLKV